MPNLPSLTLPDLDALVGKAKAATPGEWKMFGREVIVAGSHDTVVGQETRGKPWMQYEALVLSVPDADYIAALSPPVALALIALAREALERRHTIDDHSLRAWLIDRAEQYGNGVCCRAAIEILSEAVRTGELDDIKARLR